MGERLLCKQEVDGSIPFASTARTADPGRLAMLMPSAGRTGVPMAKSARSDFGNIGTQAIESGVLIAKFPDELRDQDTGTRPG